MSDLRKCAQDVIKAFDNDKKNDASNDMFNAVNALHAALAETPEAAGCSVCGEAYQVVGCLRNDSNHDVLEPVLDNLWASADGQPIPHKTLLPFAATPPVDALIAEIDGLIVLEDLGFQTTVKIADIKAILDKYRAQS